MNDELYWRPAIYINNVVMVFSDATREEVEKFLKQYFDVTCNAYQKVTPNRPYQGELRDPENTLVHVVTEGHLLHDFYTTEYIRSNLPLEAVSMPPEALQRADLVLVMLKDSDGNRYYYPYHNGLMSDNDEGYMP